MEPVVKNSQVARRWDCRKPTELICRTVGKIVAAINCKLIKKLEEWDESSFEVELVKWEIEHEKPKLVVFVILQYRKRRVSELSCMFITNFWEVIILRNLEVEADSLHLILADKTLEYWTHPGRGTEWVQQQSDDWNVSSNADTVKAIFFKLTLQITKQKQTTESLLFSKRESDVRRCFIYVVWCTTVMMLPRANLSSVLVIWIDVY